MSTYTCDWCGRDFEVGWLPKYSRSPLFGFTKYYCSKRCFVESEGNN